MSFQHANAVRLAVGDLQKAGRVRGQPGRARHLALQRIGGTVCHDSEPFWGRKAHHHRLDQAHKLTILEERMTYTPTSIPPGDREFLQTRQFQRSELSGAFGVPQYGRGPRKKSKAFRLYLSGSNGGEGQNRTVDTTIFSRMLYQLSYLATRGTHAQARPKIIARVRSEVGLRPDFEIAENPERVGSRSRRTPRSRCCD